MKITIDDIMLLPGQGEDLLPGIVQRTYNLPEPPAVKIARKSLDARKKKQQSATATE